jgi:hypothetical protein
MAVLVGDNTIVQQMPATVVIDIQDGGFLRLPTNEEAENEIISDYCPKALNVALGFCARPSASAPREPMRVRELFGRLINRQWISWQIRAIRKDGLVARLNVMAAKLGLR